MEITTIQCESGRWLGWLKDREDIMASGETYDEMIQNVKNMYEIVIEYESTTTITTSD